MCKVQGIVAVFYGTMHTLAFIAIEDSALEDCEAN